MATSPTVVFLRCVTLCLFMCISINCQRFACYPSEDKPKPCDCSMSVKRPAVTCRNKDLSKVVAGIPTKVKVLDLSFNNITRLEKNDFIGLEKLETLFLMDNNMVEIHPEAFRNLYNLKLLVLDRNKLTTISDRIFQHLPNLANINVQRNEIRIISPYAFITLAASSVTILLSENPIQCDCGLKALKKWMIDNPKRLYLNGAHCSNTRSSLPVKDTPDSEFPNCPSIIEVIPSNTSCYTCQGAVNHQQCRQDGEIAACSRSQVCSTRITNTDGKLTINKGCMWYNSCLNQERSNVRNCGSYNKPDRQCNFCCVGDGCNGGDMGGRTKEFTFSFQMTIDMIYNPDLENTSSSIYQRLAVMVDHWLRSSFSGIDGGQTWEINGFRRPNTTVSATIFTTNLNTHSAQSVQALLTTHFKDAAASDGSLSELGVRASSIIVEIYSGVFCPEDVLTTSQGTFIWPRTFSGRQAVIRCPNKDSQSASRVCAISSGDAQWLTPQIAACANNSSADDELKRLLDTPVTNDNVRGVLDSLKSLTSVKGGLNKAQLSLAVGVLENILKLEFSFSDMSVMNGTVAVVSQLLVTNDDVLLEAEEEFHTSSKILDSVDTISNKISLTNGDVRIVEPNLVLAAISVKDGNFSGLTITTKSEAKDGSLSNFEVNKDDEDDNSNNDSNNPNDDDNNNNDDGNNDDDKINTTDRIRENEEDDNGSDNYPELEEADTEDDDSDQYGQDDRANSLELPKSLFSGLTAAEKTSLERITFHVFPTGTLFSSIAGKNSTDTIAIKPGYHTKINSGVISASVPNVEIKHLLDPVKMTFSHSSKNSSNARCVYWDDGVKSGAEGWSSEGCRVLINVQGSHTTCICDHLTNFALLMDVYQDGYRISETDKKILSIISYIGCSLSFLCLVLTLLTYILFNGPTSSTDSSQNNYKSDGFGNSIRKLRKDNPSKILVNLCIALALADLVFIVGMHSYAMDNAIGCKIVAVLLHYFLLSALSWMAVEAFYMYLALVLVFKTYYSKFMLKCCVVGWGVPLIIVVITLAINETNNYAKLDSGICWMVSEAFYGAFAGPVLLVLLINFVAFSLVLRQLCGLQAKKLTKSDRADKLSKVRGAVGVVILLGLTWVFAIFAIGPVQTLFSYLFAIFNALQGLFIFVFYCLFKKDALNSWRRMLPCCEVVDEKSSRGYSGTTPASNSGNKTMSTYNDVRTTTKKRVYGKYEVSTDSTNGGFDNNGDYDNNNSPASTYI